MKYKISLLTYVEAENDNEAELLGKKALEQEVADRNFDIEEVEEEAE